MKIPFTFGVCTVNIFKLSKESQRVGHWEECHMHKGQGKRKKGTKASLQKAKSEDYLQIILKKSSHILEIQLAMYVCFDVKV